MNNALLYFGGLLVVTLAALFAVPHFVDWNGYRGVFEEEASKVLGRDVRVGGAVNVRFLPTPFVRFEKVRLADPTGQTGEPFVSADSFTMRLSGPALLRGVLEANEIELDRPELTLALDNQGGGNWTSVQIKPGALPFIPKNVALHSVKIVEGAVAFYNADAQQITRADNINGEFSAEALTGPFKFKGNVNWSGEVRELKFATTVPDAAGVFQIKANTRGVASETAYALDATVEDLSGKPRLTGALTGKLPLQTTAGPGAIKPAEPAVMDLTSRIEATTKGAKIGDITLSLENVAEPQLITGSASAVWGTAPRLDVALASKWLDLDRLAGAGQDSATFLKIKQLGLSVLRGLAGSGEAVAKIDIDQVKLGGETAGAMKVDAARVGSTVRLNELKAGLPGGARLDLSGDLKDDAGKVSFQGPGFIHGSNLARLLDWAAKSGANLDIKSDGPFTAEGQVLIAENRLELTEASAEIGGRPFAGDVVVSGDTVRRVAVTLEAASLNSSELFPQTAMALETSLRRALGVAPLAATSNEPAEAKPPAAADGDMSVRILAGELKHGDQVFRNVDATVRLDGGNIRIPSAKFTTPAGLAVGIDARISDAQSKPKGTLAYDFVASSAAAVKDLVTYTGLAPSMPAEHVGRVTSAKLAGLVRLGARSATSADVSVDGTVQSARIVANAEFDGGLQAWRAGMSRTRVTARAPALAPLLAALGFNAPVNPTESSHEAELVFASSGQIGAGAAATLEMTAPALQMSYDGRLTLPDGGPLKVDGNARVKTDSAVDALAVVGVPSTRGIAGVPVEGTIAVSRDGGKWNLASRKLIAGSAMLNGTASAGTAADGVTEFSADLHADKLTVPGLLALLHDAPSSPADAATTPETTTGIWSSRAFNFAPIENVKGAIRLSYGTLGLQPGVLARSGTLEFAITPSTISIARMTGQAAGGTLSGAVALAKAPSGIKLDGDLRIEDADLAQLSASARGKATLEAKADAQAQSPAGLIAVLNGSGNLTLEGAVVPAPGPSTASSVIDSVLKNKLANRPEDVTAAMQQAASVPKAELGSQSIPIAITDGVAKLDTVVLESPEGKVSAATVVELSTFAIDSAWKLSAIVPPLPPLPEPLPGWIAPAPKGALPPVSIVYTGSLGNLPQVAMALDASDMQRELAVRLLERNVEELERLRRLDEHRAKQEQQRRLTLEEERAAAAAAAKAAASKPPAAAAPAPQAPAPAPLPPILPESSGTPVDPQSSAPQTAAPPAETSATGEIAAETGDPAAVVEPPPAPQPAVRPRPTPRPSQARRTTSDEVMRSLGGYP